MKLIEEESKTIFTVNGIKNFYLFLIHEVQQSNFQDAKDLFVRDYNRLANIDLHNAQGKFLESAKTYTLLFNDITQKIIPRSSISGEFEGDSLIYIPQYEIIEGWD